MILPPKRFDSPDNPKYDSIRHRPWFRLTLERRGKIPFLKAAKDKLVEIGSQKETASMYRVDERELRDYCRFVDGISPNYQDAQEKRTFQRIIDDAYASYVADKAKYNFRDYIANNAGYFGALPRHVLEAWEIDPNLLPTGYNENQ